MLQQNAIQYSTIQLITSNIKFTVVLVTILIIFTVSIEYGVAHGCVVAVVVVLLLVVWCIGYGSGEWWW